MTSAGYTEGMMSQEVRDWCYRQCEIQHATTPADIAGMEQAWEYAEAIQSCVAGFELTVVDIQFLGHFVDPVANPGGAFRKGPAVFFGGGSAASAQSIEMYLTNLVNAQQDAYPIGPEQFYRELMWIHPFKDGNGRVGALVYNVLNGTIDNPVDPPEYR